MISHTVWLGKVEQGGARLGRVRFVLAWQGAVRYGVQRSGLVGYGEAGRGKASGAGTTRPILRGIEMSTKGQLALIHVGKKRLGLDEESYRSILKTHGGAESAKDLTDFGVEKVLSFFKQLGFSYRKPKNRQDFTILRTRKQKAMIFHLMEDLTWWAVRLNKFILKMTGKDSVDLLTKEEASRIIEGLKSMRNRAVTWD
jgi:hypothetical protein